MFGEENGRRRQPSQESYSTERKDYKENIPLRVNYEQKKDKKFTYGFLN